MSRIRDRSGDIVEGDVVYLLAEPEMRFAYGVKYLRYNRKTKIMTPIGWSGTYGTGRRSRPDGKGLGG